MYDFMLQNVGVVDSHFAELESQEFWCSWITKKFYSVHEIHLFIVSSWLSWICVNETSFYVNRSSLNELEILDLALKLTKMQWLFVFSYTSFLWSYSFCYWFKWNRRVIFSCEWIDLDIGKHVTLSWSGRKSSPTY